MDALRNQFFMETSKNKIVKAADQTDIDFYELEDGDPIEVGAKATVDGIPAGDYFKDTEGRVVNADGETYVFVGEELMEILPKEDASASSDYSNEDEVAALQAKIEELEGVNATLTAKLEEKSATNKQLRTALNNVRKLESEIVETAPSARPTASTASKAPVKGQRFAQAMDKFKTHNTK